MSLKPFNSGYLRPQLAYKLGDLRLAKLINTWDNGRLWGRFAPGLNLVSPSIVRWKMFIIVATNPWCTPNMIEQQYISNPDDFVTLVNIIPKISLEMNKWRNWGHLIPHCYCSLPNPCCKVCHLERVLGSDSAEADRIWRRDRWDQLLGSRSENRLVICSIHYQESFYTVTL